MPAITTFKRPVDAPQGWSLTPARILEAADLSVEWRSQGRPELQSRARAVHQIRTIEEQSPHGPFLRTLEVTSTKMPVELFHEVLLVQNLIFHWTEDEDALAKSAWPQASPEEIEEPMNASVGARAVALPTAESIQACAKSPPLAGPSTVSSLSPELSPEPSRPVVEAPPLAEPSLKVNLKRRRAEPVSTAREEEPISSGRPQKNKDPEPIAEYSYGIIPRANMNPGRTAVRPCGYGHTPSNKVPKGTVVHQYLPPLPRYGCIPSNKVSEGTVVRPSVSHLPAYGIAPSNNRNLSSNPFAPNYVADPRASKKPKLMVAGQRSGNGSTSTSSNS